MCFQLSLHCLRYLFFTKSMYELFQDICNRLVFSFSLFQFLLQSRHVRFSTLNGGNRKNVNFKNSLPRTTCRITLIKDRQNNPLLPQYKKNFNHLRCFYLFKQYILIEDLSQNTVKKKKALSSITTKVNTTVFPRTLYLCSGKQVTEAYFFFHLCSAQIRDVKT